MQARPYARIMRSGRDKDAECLQIVMSVSFRSADTMRSATTPIPPWAVPRPDVTRATLERKAILPKRTNITSQEGERKFAAERSVCCSVIATQ